MFFISSSAFAQEVNFISKIRSIVERINTDSAYKTKTLGTEEFMREEETDGGGSLTGYFKNGELKKINEWVGLSNGIVTIEYFLDHGDLIFAYERKKSFQYINKPDTSYWDYQDQRVIRENRFYFRHGKLIKKHIKGDQDPSSDDTELIGWCKKYSALLQK